jgi:hypothetical protein
MEEVPDEKGLGASHLALASFEAPVGLVDDVDAALTPHQPVIAVAGPQRFQGITDFHDNLEGSKVAGLISIGLAPVNETGSISEPELGTEFLIEISALRSATARC